MGFVIAERAGDGTLKTEISDEVNQASDHFCYWYINQVVSFWY